MIQPKDACFFDKIYFRNSFLKGVETFCAFPRLRGKVYVWGGSLLRQSQAALQEERTKGKTVEVVKAVFMILFFPLTIIAYSVRQIARLCISNRKNKAEQIISKMPLDETGLCYGRSILSEQERKSFNKEHLMRIIWQTPKLPEDKDILYKIKLSELAGWHTEILPDLVVGGIRCDMGINYGYPKDPENHFSETEKTFNDTPLFNPIIGEKFNAATLEQGIFDVLVSTHSEWGCNDKFYIIKGKKAHEIYLKEGGEHILGIVDSELFEQKGTEHLVGAVKKAVDAWKKGYKVSVQCAQGMDRSVTFIICMLYHMTKIDPTILIDFVNRKRAISNTFTTNDTPD